MNFFQALNDLRRDLVDRIIPNALAQIFIVTQFGKSSELGAADAIQTADESPAGERQTTQRPVTRVEPFGFRSRPTSKVRGAALRLGSSNVLFIGILPTQGYGPQDLEDGETALYSAEVPKGVHLDKDGNVNANAKSGKKVNVGSPDGSGAEPAVLGDTLETRLHDLELKFLAHTHQVPYSWTGTPGSSTATAGATSSTLPHDGDNIKASNVTVK